MKNQKLFTTSVQSKSFRSSNDFWFENRFLGINSDNTATPSNDTPENPQQPETNQEDATLQKLEADLLLQQGLKRTALQQKSFADRSDPEKEEVQKIQDQINKIKTKIATHQQIKSLLDLSLAELAKKRIELSREYDQLPLERKPEEQLQASKLDATIKAIERIIRVKEAQQQAREQQKLNEGDFSDITPEAKVEKQLESLDSFSQNLDQQRLNSVNAWRRYLHQIKDLSNGITHLEKLIERFSIRDQDNPLFLSDNELLEVNKIYSLYFKAAGVLGKNVRDKTINQVNSQVIKDIKEDIKEMGNIRHEMYKGLMQMMTEGGQGKVMVLNDDHEYVSKTVESEGFTQRLKALRKRWNEVPDDDETLARDKQSQLHAISEYEKVVNGLRILVNGSPQTKKYQEITKLLRNPEVEQRQLAILKEKQEHFRNLFFKKTTEIDGYNQSLNGPNSHQLKPEEREDLKQKLQVAKQMQQSYEASRQTAEQQATRLQNKTYPPSLDELYEYHSNLNEQIQALENQSLQALQDAQELNEETGDGPVPEWSDICSSFRDAFDKYQDIFGTSDNEEGSKFAKAAETASNVIHNNIIQKTIKQLKALNMSGEKRNGFIKELNAAQEILSAMPGLKNALDHSYSPQKTHDNGLFDPNNPQPNIQKLNQYVNTLNEALVNTESAISKSNAITKSLDDLNYQISTAKQFQAPIDTSSQIEWLRPDTIKTIYEEIFRWWEEDYQRNHKERVGSIGESITNYQVFGSLPNDFRLQKERGEEEAVGKYKEAYDLMDNWALLAELEVVKDRYYLKALLRSLADKGFLRFQSKDLCRAISKFSNGVVTFKYDEAGWNNEIRDPHILSRKIERGILAIWGDENLFNELKHAHNDAYENQVKKHDYEAGQLASSETGLQGACAEMLEEWMLYKAQGETPPGFDPHRYEAFIRYGTEAGKMDPHAKFYFVLQGVTHGILTRERVGIFSNEFGGKFPVMEFFDTHPEIDNLKAWSTVDGPTGNPPRFKPSFKFWKWYHKYLLQNDTVEERTQKIFTQANIAYDHDEIGGIVTVMNAESVKQLLRWKGSAGRFAESGIQNMYCGMLWGMQVHATTFNQDSEEDKKQLIQFLDGWLTLHMIAGNLLDRGKENNYIRLSDNMINDKAPRMAGGAFATRQQKTRVYIDRMKNYVTSLDPTLFKLIFDGDKFNDNNPDKDQFIKEVHEHVTTTYGNGILPPLDNIKSVNEIYTSLSKIIRAIVNKAVAEGYVNTLMDAVRSDLKNIDLKGKDDKYNEMIEPLPPV